MEHRIVAEINAELGSKVENLSKSHALVDKYVTQLNAIEEKVKIFADVAFVYVVRFQILILVDPHEFKCIACAEGDP